MTRTPDAPVAGAYQVHEIESCEEFASLAREWDELLSASPADIPFLTHGWLCTWWRHFGTGRRLAVQTARHDGRLVAALPLMEEAGGPPGARLIVLRSLTNFHSNRWNAIARRGEEGALAAIWEYLRRRPRPWHLLRLEEVPEDTPALEPLLSAARHDGHAVAGWRGGDSPYLRLGGTWEQYHSSLSKNARASLRKKGRRLDEECATEVVVITRPEETGAAIDEALAVEASGWKAEAGSAILNDPALASFYREWGEIAARQGWLRISLLRARGRAIASDYSVEYGGVYYALKIGYDPAWQPYSVGQLLKAEILKRCFRDGIREYDFLGVMTRAKEDWSPSARAHWWHFVYNRGLLPRAHYLYKFRLLPRLKGLRRP